MAKRRLFLGFPVLPSVGRTLESQAKIDIDTSTDCLRWTNEHDFHVTSSFIGDVGDEYFSEIHKRFLNLDLPTDAIDCEIVGIEPFPQHGSKLLAAIIRQHDMLDWVHHAGNQLLKTLGLPTDGRPYRPHITLARGLKSNDRHQMAIRQPLMLDKLTLFESKINSFASKYEQLETRIFC